MCYRIVLTLAVLLLPPAAVAQQPSPVELSFPLGEHHRVGRYVPVRVILKTSGLSDPLRVEVTGAIPIEVAPAGGTVDAVVPLLPVTALQDVRWTMGGAGGTQPHGFRALADDERLVGSTATGAEADALAGQLFPDKKILTVPLNLADPLPGPAVAWGTLDAVLLDPAAAARVDEAQLTTLLAAGTAVAVRAVNKPAGEWPWERRGGWWVASPELRGPDGLVEPLAYEPAVAWNPGWPASFRRTLVLALVAFSIVVIALTLWRSGRATLAAVALVLITLGGLAAWRAAATTTRSVSGAVWVRGAGWDQFDTWTYHRGLAAATQTEHALDVTRPVFASRRHFEQAGLTLEVGDGTWTSPRFRYLLDRGRTIAFLHRRVDAPQHGAITFDESPSPLPPLAQRLYLRHGDRIAGSALLGLPHAPPDDYELWPVVLIAPAGADETLTPAPRPATSPAARPR